MTLFAAKISLHALGKTFFQPTTEPPNAFTSNAFMTKTDLQSPNPNYFLFYSGGPVLF
jgi:hypothetical protein